jgi:hypothetical protein
VTASDDDRCVPAPELAEVARTWWDVDHDPVVVWDPSATRFELADPADPTARLQLVTLRTPAPDPPRAATRLAEAFAACDFPPTGDGVPVASAVRVARDVGLDPEAGD